MEPSLGGYSADTARARVEAGFRNFLFSIEDFILHFCVLRYLCSSGQRYHITDVSKGAMPVASANNARVQRYGEWDELLQDEIALVADPNARIIAVGNAVSDHLTRRGFPRPFTQVIHYSGQAARARSERIKKQGRKDDFLAFRDSVSLEDVVAAAEGVLSAAQVPGVVREETLVRLARSELTTSRQALIFNYKLAFEGLRFGPATHPPLV